MDPCPVITATSVRGNSFLTLSKNCRPDMRGITISVRIMCAGFSSSCAKADSPLSASMQLKPSDSPTVMQRRRILCSSSTINSRIRRSSLTSFTHSRFYNWQELLYPERLFHTRSAGFAKCVNSLIVSNVASDKDNAGCQVGTVLAQPCMDIRACDSPWSSHVGNHA